MSQEQEPLISVVIASVNGLPAIEECLEALMEQEGEVAYEVVVVDCCDATTRQAIRRFPSERVRLLEVEGRPSIPRLRALGMAAAGGRMIAILEDHCNVVPGWIEVIARAHAAGHQAIGGAVENGSRERLVDWAVFFCEYARFMPPIPRGVVAEITGNNSVYERGVLEQLGPELENEVWESFMHQRLRDLGVEFYCDPDLLVSHKKEFGFFYFLSQRYHYSRSFAGMRLAGESLWKRLAYVAATPALPPLLALRIGRTVWSKKKYRGTLIKTLPVLGVFLLMWAWGEAVGAALGPGDSLSRVE
jgi:glycosyltransferase involved in cell wall biosynthesis